MGNFVLALGVCAFMAPQGIIMGGVTGLAISIQKIVDIPLFILIYALNILAFIVGGIFLGKKFVVGTALSTILFPFFFSILNAYSPITRLTNNALLSAIYGGALIGLGVGLVFRTGSSTGGMDVPPLIIHKKTGLSLSLLVKIVDVVVLGFQFPFSNTEQILFGILAVFVTTYVMEKTMLLGESKVQVFIISPKADEIKQVIHQDVNRGCTLIKITTGYQNVDQDAVMTVVSRREQFILNQIVLDIDPTAFIITNEAHSVHGRGFTLPNIDL